MAARIDPPALEPLALVDAIPDCVLVIDTDAVVRFANRAVEVQLGHSVSEYIGRSVLDLIHPDDVNSVLSSIVAVRGKVVGTLVEVRVRDRAGGWHWYEQVGTNVELDDGTPAILCVARNITQRRMWEVASNDTARLQQVLQVAPAITLLLDADAVVTSVNSAFTRMLGHDQSVVVGRSLLSFIADGHDAQAREAFADLRDGQMSAVFEAHMIVVGDRSRTRPVRFEMVNHLADPVVCGIVVSAYDVSELEAAREELEYLAQHDALTGLATRARLERHMEHLLSSAQPFAVLFIDLDGFKPVNDVWGHHTGDDVLRLVARRLAHHTKAVDLVARLGGDEFVMVAHGIEDAAAARSLSDRVTDAISARYDVGAGPIRIGASVGIAISTPSSTVASILAAADGAMYDTKRLAIGR